MIRAWTIWILAALLVLAAMFFMAGCGGTLAQLGRSVEPPRFEEADDHPAEIRPRARPRPAVGLTLSTLDSTLLLEGSPAAGIFSRPRQRSARR